MQCEDKESLWTDSADNKMVCGVKLADVHQLGDSKCNLKTKCTNWIALSQDELVLV